MTAISVTPPSSAQFRRSGRKATGSDPAGVGSPPRRRVAVSARPVSRIRLALGLAVLAWLVVFVGAGIGAAGAGDVDAGNASTVLAAGRTHRVLAGETLWSIATRSNEGGDTRKVVADIVSLNHLSGSSVAAGQVLILP